MSADLEQKITFREILEWEMHWLTVELDYMLRDLKRGPVVDLDDAIKFYQKTLSDFHRTIWKAATMFQMDYHNTDIYPGLVNGKKYLNFFASMTEFKIWVIDAKKIRGLEDLERTDRAMRSIGPW